MSAVTTPDGQHDFDFFFGTWHILNHRLTHILQGSNEWYSFEATQKCWPVLGGLGNCDELQRLDGEPIGMSLRFFNLTTQQWNIYWVSKKDGIMQPPVVGTFSDGIGIFEGEDVYDNIPIRVRFTWFSSRENPRWQQEFSNDGGITWEKNWEMIFTRIE